MKLIQWLMMLKVLLEELLKIMQQQLDFVSFATILLKYIYVLIRLLNLWYQDVLNIDSSLFLRMNK